MSDGYEVHGFTAVITINNPPVNSLSQPVRKSIVENLDRAVLDESVKAIVITGAGKAFSAGADIREFNTPAAAAEPHLHSVLSAIEESPKPVIAAIHSVCLGAGLELALACHFRVARPGAQIGQPEVKIGLCPGAGGTQRLPRVLGLETALNMIVGGDAVDSQALACTRLFDSMIEGDLLAGAVEFAETVVNDKRGLPRIRDLKTDYPNYEAYLQFARNSIRTAAPGYPAPLRCVDAIEAAVTKPFEEGLRYEFDVFLQLMASVESRALIHVFFARKACARVPGISEKTALRPVKKAAIIGAGTMGSGIAMAFVNSGIPVTMLEIDQGTLDRGVAKVSTLYEESIRKGNLRREEYDRRMSLLSTTLDYGAIADCDIVIEAVFEDLRVKREVFERLDSVMKPGAILATNTSTLDVNRIAKFTKRPEDVAGAHFFSPAHMMKLLEVVRGDATSPEVIATLMQLAAKLGKTAVVSGVCDGFIGNRMMEQYARQAEFLLEEGCSPQQVDRAIEQFGFVMGPFRVADLVGNDVVAHIRKRWGEDKPHVRYSELAERLSEMGRLGQKTGSGWYDYLPGSRHAFPSKAVDEMIHKYRQETGIVPRKVADEEIVTRLVYALINEGARILEEGIALRGSDIDIVFLMGYGFPPWRGGPMFYADTVGLHAILRRMRLFAANPHADPGFWRPAPLLERLAAEGKHLSERESGG